MMEIQPVDSPAKASMSDRIIDWAFAQGVSTILLGVLAAGLWYGIPWARTCMKEDIKQILDVTERNVDKTIEAFAADQARDQQLIDQLLHGAPRPVAKDK